MRYWFIVWMGISVIGMAVSPAWGEEPGSGEEPPGWKGNLELSYLNTGGNTNSQSFFGGGKLARVFVRSTLSAEGKALYSESDGVTSDKSWWGRLKYEWRVNERAFTYASQEAQRDVLKGIEVRYITQLGLGYYVIKTSADLLKAEAGLGYVRENPIAHDPDPPFAELDDFGYPSGRAFGEYTHSFTEKTRFTQTAEYIPNFRERKDYIFREESSFVAQVIGSLGLKVSYFVEYDNQPLPGFFKTDRVFKASLLYEF